MIKHIKASGSVYQSMALGACNPCERMHGVESLMQIGTYQDGGKYKSNTQCNENNPSNQTLIKCHHSKPSIRTPKTTLLSQQELRSYWISVVGSQVVGEKYRGSTREEHKSDHHAETTGCHNPGE